MSFDTRTRPNDPPLLFDMDGVLIEGSGTPASIHSAALDDVLDEYGLDPDGDLYRALDEHAYTDAFADACREIGVDPVDFYAAREQRSTVRSIEHLKAGARTLCPDVDALEALAEHHDLALVSNNYDPTVAFVVDHFRLDYFEFARGRDLGVEGFSRRKPDPYYLREALDHLGVSDAIYVGDRETDVRAATRAGLDGIYLRRDHNADAELAVEPVAEIESLHQLSPLLGGTD
jgi:HAD superfamily hydrolase (TIGR01549 family)